MSGVQMSRINSPRPPGCHLVTSIIALLRRLRVKILLGRRQNIRMAHLSALSFCSVYRSDGS